MAEGTPPRDAPPGVSPVRATTPGASPGARAPDATPPSAVPETPPDSRFGSPVAADALAPGGASPTIRGDKFALTSPQSADSPASPHLTQGAPGHVARVVDWAEREAQGELLSAEKPTRSDRERRSGRGSLTSSVVGGFAAATSGALERLRASRNAPETPVMPPKTRRSLRDALPEEQEEEIALARRMSPLALDEPAEGSSRETARASAQDGKNLSSDLVEVTVDPYDFDAFAEEVERVTARVPERSPSPASSSPASSAVPETPQTSGPAATDAGDARSPTPSPSAGPATSSSPALDEREEATRGSGFVPEDDRAAEEARARAQILAATAATSASPVRSAGGEVDANGRETAVVVAETATETKENGAMAVDDGVSGGFGGPAPRAPALRPGDLASNAFRVTDSRAAVLLPKRSAAPTAAPSAQKKKLHPRNLLPTKGSPTKGGQTMTTVMTPLPINQSILDRIDALGPEMQPAQKTILLLGIALDLYAKTQLIRELRRFALMGDDGGWGWFAAVFLFFLLSGSATAAYWLVHYPMPSAKERAELVGKHAPRVFGFTKLDFKKMVRTAGAVAAMCQLGTAFAAWRALRVKDLRQRKAEMDLRGMQLVDAVFLLLPTATLQAYVGMKCSSPELTCPGRSGFDALLFLAVLGAITSATLCFVSLDLHEKPPSLTWRNYWRAHKAHLSETAAKSAFRFLELSARVSLIALFSAVKGGWVFFVFFMHAVIVLLGLKFWPKVVGGGVPDRGVWRKLVAVEARLVVSEKRTWWPERLFGGRSVYLPTLNDTKLLVFAMIWPPSMFVANATDAKGRFWWRSKTCPRKNFLSADRRDAVFPLPLFVALQTFEACLMFLIVGAAIGDKQHYHAYFLSAALVNIAWLMAVIGWISAAALWNPFLPEGPPLAFARGARGSGAPGTARVAADETLGHSRPSHVSEWKGWHGPDAAAEVSDDDVPEPEDFPSARGERIGEKVAFQKGANVAASMAAPGVFSPGGRTPGGRAARRASNGVAASYAVGPTETRKERSREREEVSEVSLAPASSVAAPAARALLFGGERAETREAKAEADAAEKARAAASEAAAAKAEAARLERERARAAKAEAARLEIARLDALRLEEAARAMRREKALLEERREKERAANASRPPAHRPPVGETAAAKPAKPDETAPPETTARRQSGGLFGRPGIVVSSSVAERPSP